jgi:hypothetical protein
VRDAARDGQCGKRRRRGLQEISAIQLSHRWFPSRWQCENAAKTGSRS